MTTITVTRTDDGQIVGAGEKHAKAYARFKKLLLEMQPGEIFTLDYWFPRNPKLHGLHFAMLTAVFDAQEQFADLDQLRMWVQVGAGHCEFVPGPTGKAVALPKSINWRTIDDEEFAAHHEAVKAFLRAPHATRFLWPALSDHAAGEAMDAILSEFERDRA
jgi:hypothetical protein